MLLGSSSLELQKGLSESLSGRFQLRRAHHWNFHESKEGYGISFEDFLMKGGYPGSYRFQDEEWYDYVENSIVNTVVEKDILQYASVRNPSLFRQAFTLLSHYPAQEITYTKLLGQLQERGNVELIKHYIHLFEGAYLIKTLEKYSANALRKKTSSPKVIPLAPCFYYLQKKSPLSDSELGRAFEALVGSQLLRTNSEVFYWREGKDEVDFVVKKGRFLWGIEVKFHSNSTTRGLHAFKKAYPEATCLIISTDNYTEFEQNPMSFLQNSI